jgi:hypothetical protein
VKKNVLLFPFSLSLFFLFFSFSVVYNITVEHRERVRPGRVGEKQQAGETRVGAKSHRIDPFV